MAAIRNSDETRLRARLNEVIRDSSQANVARRTGTPRASLSRYLKDRKIPADFCVRLVKRLGVNPGWLLSGEGAAYSAQMTASARTAALGILELTEALSATLRAQTAALATAPSARVLRELSARIDEVERLETRLVDVVRPVFDRLLIELDEAYYGGREAQATALLESLKQAARLARDAAMEDRLDEALAFRENQRGNFAGAMEIRSRCFHRSLLRRGGRPEDWCEQDSNYLGNLYHCFRLEEARRAARLLLALHAGSSDSPEHSLIRYHAGYLDFELGRARRGWRLMAEAHPRAPAAQRQFLQGSYFQSQLLTGLFAMDDAVALALGLWQGFVQPARSGMARSLARSALWIESLPALESVTRHFERDLDGSEDRGFRLLALQVRAVTALLSGAPLGDEACDLDEPLLQESLACSEHRLRFPALLFAAQRARLAGDPRATDFVRECAELLAAMAPEYIPWLALRVLHARNVLGLEAGDESWLGPARVGARSFLAQHRARGYHGIAAALAPVAGAM